MYIEYICACVCVHSISSVSIENPDQYAKKWKNIALLLYSSKNNVYFDIEDIFWHKASLIFKY